MMERALDLIIVSDSPISGHLIQLALSERPRICRSRVVSAAAPRDPGTEFAGDVCLIAMHDWRELAALLPCLRRRLARSPWLLLAERRLAGMFLASLRDQPCALVAPTATPAELWERLESLMDCRFCLLEAELIARFAHGVAVSAGVPSHRLASPPELQCACAVSLGLSNRQIAAALHLQESSVKTYLYRLMKKLGVHDRKDLAAIVSSALTDEPRLSAGRAAR